MMMQTILLLLLASGRPNCRAVAVAGDLFLSEGRCGEDFRGGLGGGHELVSVSRNYPEFDLALFTSRSRWRGRIAELTRDDGLELGTTTDQGAVVSLDARHFRLRGDPEAPFVWRAGRLIGVRDATGGFIRVANDLDWLELKIGGD